MPQTREPDLVHSVSRPFDMRRPAFVAKRRRWPGLLAASAMAAGLAGLAVSSHDDSPRVGTQPDAGVAAATSSVQTDLTEGARVVDDRADVPARND